jgi:hypothetical protein
MACRHTEAPLLPAGGFVASDHGHAASVPADATQPSSRRGAQRQSQLSGQILIGDSAPTIGAEQSSDADKPVINGARSPKRRGYRQSCTPNRYSTETQTIGTARTRVRTPQNIAARNMKTKPPDPTCGSGGSRIDQRLLY